MALVGERTCSVITQAVASSPFLGGPGNAGLDGGGVLGFPGLQGTVHAGEGEGRGESHPTPGVILGVWSKPLIGSDSAVVHVPDPLPASIRHLVSPYQGRNWSFRERKHRLPSINPLL